MIEHFALLPESGGLSVGVECDEDGVMLDVGEDYYTILTPAEARQIAAALNRAGALCPVPA